MNILYLIILVGVFLPVMADTAIMAFDLIKRFCQKG